LIKKSVFRPSVIPNLMIGIPLNMGFLLVGLALIVVGADNCCCPDSLGLISIAADPAGRRPAARWKAAPSTCGAERRNCKILVR
jgi:hypothetical protein